MSIDILEQIHEKLEELQTELTIKCTLAKSNRDAAIALCHFIADTIRTVAPDSIDPSWYGSYDNSSVYDYPNVTIHAVYRPTCTTLATWRVNCGGANETPVVTTEEIISAVLEGLNRVTV